MKTNAIIRIVIWSAVIVLLAFPLIAVLLGGIPLNRMYTAETFAETAPTEAVAAMSTLESGEKIRLSPEDVTDIEIEWVAGSIVIQPADVEYIQISESDVSDAKDTMVYHLKNGKLSIDFCEDYDLDSFMGISIHTNTLTKDLCILVPWGWECATLEVDAASATLEVNDLTIREVEIDTASGACWFDMCTVDQLDLDTASGDIQFVGNLNILDCDAASANVRAVLGNVPTRMDLDSMSGDLDVTLPVDAGFTAKIDAMSSEFTSDFPTTQVNGNHVCGDGSCRISVNAMSGDVIIRQAAAATAHAHTEECTTNPDSCPDNTEHHEDDSHK